MAARVYRSFRFRGDDGEMPIMLPPGAAYPQDNQELEGKREGDTITLRPVKAAAPAPE